MRTIRMRSVALVAAAMLAGTLAGCSATGAGEEGAGAEPAEAEVVNDEAPEDATEDATEDAAVEEDEPEEADDGDEVPEWVSANFPIHPDSSVSTVSEHQTAAEDLEILIIGFIVSAESQDVIDWYNDAYNKDGWSTESGQGDGSRFNAEHGEDYSAVVGVTPAGNMAVVTITATQW